MQVIRFVPNEPDNLHCLQSCFQMIAETLTGQSFASATIENLTNFVQGKPTWPFAGMYAWLELGLEVNYIEEFPFSIFVDNPEKAIRLQFTDSSVAQQIIEVSEFDREVHIAKKVFEHPGLAFFERIPTLDDIRDLLNQENMLMANVNYWSLLGESKYAGHFVIIESIENNEVTLQNPGLPPIENQIVPVETFMRAWCYPDAKAANIIGVKRHPGKTFV